ncbi:hypothetical protein B0H14DRAFT_2566635 [Mycena olivaceomarginata]|nr:hypothetical protein B0H14DRAFT_2566635 [Mycena olivaceomarginata]
MDSPGTPACCNKKKPNLYVGINLDGTRVHRTHIINRDSVPKWNDVCTLSPDQLSARLSFHVYHESVIPLMDDFCLAAVDIDIGTLRERCGTLGNRRKVKSAGTLSMCLAAIGIVESGKIETAGAQKAVQDLESSAVVSSVTGVVDTIVNGTGPVPEIQHCLRRHWNIPTTEHGGDFRQAKALFLTEEKSPDEDPSGEITLDDLEGGDGYDSERDF